MAQVAKEVLRGRNATVFEKHVLNPFFGRPKESCEALAKQFGCSVDRIYKINERNRKRVENAMRQRREVASLSRPADERERCPTCGFVYDNFGQGPECNRGYGWCADPKKIHPECARRFRPFPLG